MLRIINAGYISEIVASYDLQYLFSPIISAKTIGLSYNNCSSM